MRKGFLTSCLAISVLVAGPGCTKADEASPQSDKSSVSRETNFDPPSPPADRSLTVEQYIDAGVPATDRTWSGADMVRVADSLGKIAEADLGRLPRYKSERSGAVFDKITGGDNYELLRNKLLPLQQRLMDGVTLMQAGNQVMILYVRGYSRGATGDSELVELQGMQLRMCVVMLELVGELVPTLDRNDPTYVTRMRGLKQMRSGLATMLAGCLQSLTERNAYRASELKRLIGYLDAAIPDILPQLPEGSRRETLVQLGRLAGDPALKDLKTEIDSLQATAKKAAEGGTPLAE